MAPLGLRLRTQSSPCATTHFTPGYPGPPSPPPALKLDVQSKQSSSASPTDICTYVRGKQLMPSTEHSLSAVCVGAGFGAGFSGDEECAGFAVDAMRSRTPYPWALEWRICGAWPF
eukprot:1158108-Pelagomonas_calceolata.AAC.7